MQAIKKEKVSKKLSEKLVLSRCRCDNIETLKKLNLWGQGISDVELVRKMPQLEVVSLSGNSITNMEPFSDCPKIRELYLRNNKLNDLSQVACFTQCKELEKLWLSDNPCTETAHYRGTVLVTLPQLTFLDNLEISDEERKSAQLTCTPIVRPGLPAPATKIETAQPAAKIETAQPAAKIETAQPAAKIETAQPAAKIETAQPAAKIETAQPAAKIETAQPAAKIETAQPAAKIETAQPATKIETAEPKTSNKVTESMDDVAYNGDDQEEPTSVVSSVIREAEVVEERKVTEAWGTHGSNNLVYVASKPVKDVQPGADATKDVTVTSYEPTLAVGPAPTASSLATPNQEKLVLSLKDHNKLRKELGLKPLDMEASTISTVVPAPKVGPTVKTQESEVCTACLHLIKVLDKESLQVVSDAIASRLRLDFAQSGEK